MFIMFTFEIKQLLDYPWILNYSLRVQYLCLIKCNWVLNYGVDIDNKQINKQRREAASQNDW